MNITKLYLNNYKGFVDAYLEFKDINFLVGENSTGKSAMLDVMRVLSSNSFQYNADLNGENRGLGYFNEIVNQRLTTENRKVEIGFERNNGRNDANIKFELFSYCGNNDDIPQLESYRCLCGSTHIKIVYPKEASKIYFFKKKSDTTDFLEWVHDMNFSDVKRKEINIHGEIHGLPFFIVRNIVIHQNSVSVDQLKPLNLLIKASKFRYFAPIRAEARKYYEGITNQYSSEGVHIPEILKRIYERKDKTIIDALNAFGSESAMYDEICVKILGRGKNVPFELTVKYGDLEANMANVGYGVSQVLPLVVEILISSSTVFSIQQPEVHLHPRAQAAFGKFIYESYSKNNNNFLIETHSDYTIDRFRLQLRKNEMGNKSISQILFFERTENGTKVTPIAINPDGTYDKNQPESFRKFFLEEELELLQL